MKLRLGLVCIVAAGVLLAVAITMRDYAMVVAMLGVGFALVGTGLLCEATDPRRRSNPIALGIAAERIAAGDEIEVDFATGRVRRLRPAYDDWPWPRG